MTQPLYHRDTGAVVGELSAPVPIERLTVGDQVWDERNDELAIFDGPEPGGKSYYMQWPAMVGPDGLGGLFCGFPGSCWRRVTWHHDKAGAQP